MNIERDFPKCLKGLTDSGIGSRKAKRMIRRAVFTLHKRGLGWAIWDGSPWSFCFHDGQGNYEKDWQHASHL